MKTIPAVSDGVPFTVPDTIMTSDFRKDQDF